MSFPLIPFLAEVLGCTGQVMKSDRVSKSCSTKTSGETGPKGRRRRGGGVAYRSACATYCHNSLPLPGIGNCDWWPINFYSLDIWKWESESEYGNGSGHVRCGCFIRAAECHIHVRMSVRIWHPFCLLNKSHKKRTAEAEHSYSDAT